MKYLRALMIRLSSLIHCTWVKILYNKRFSFSAEEIIANSTHFTIVDAGEIHIGKKCGIRRNCEISAVKHGKILIGDHFFMNKGCIIAAHENIVIGDNTRFGPNVMLFDHDYDFKNPEVKLRNEHKTAPIEIGNNVWLGAGVIVLRGTKIGDNCVVGAGTVLKGCYEPNTIIVQTREDVISEIRYHI